MTLAVFIGLIGLLCLYGEFFLPGGILAFFAVVIMLGSLVLFFMESSEIWMGCLYTVLLVLSSIGVCLFALKNVRRSNNSFCLHEDQEGFVSSSFEEDLVLKEGVVSTELKPAGHVRIEGKVYQALSQGDFVSKGSIIEVVSMRGSHLIVKLKK